MKRLKIGIDVDGVLADFISTFRTIAEEVTGRELPEQPDTWEWDNWNLTKEECNKSWQIVKDTKNFWSNIDSYDNTDLYHLNREHYVYFITSRVETKGESIKEQTAEWLDENHSVYSPAVIVTSGPSHKAEIAAALKLDYFIDDCLDNLYAIQINNSRPGTRLFLMDQEYNRKVNNSILPESNYTRVSNIAQFLKATKTDTGE